MSDRPAPPPGRIVRLTDVDQLSELFSNWRGRFEQISEGRFEATLRVVRGGVVRALAIDANQRVRLRGRDDDGLCWVHPVTPKSAASLWQGRELAAGQMVLNGSDVEFDYTSPRHTVQQSVSVLPDALTDAARVLLHPEAVELPRHWTAVSPAPAAVARVQAQIARFLAVGVATPGALRTAEGHRLEQECVRAVVTALGSEHASRPDLPLPARSRLVQQAEQYMRDRLVEPVGAIDLCRQLKVSDRTLRLAFRERYGIGPMGYYKRLRLNAVRTALRADPRMSVAAAAVTFGFHHLSNFAADYRRLFWENPSDTPRCPPDRRSSPPDPSAR